MHQLINLGISWTSWLCVNHLYFSESRVEPILCSLRKFFCFPLVKSLLFPAVSRSSLGHPDSTHRTWRLSSLCIPFSGFLPSWSECTEPMGSAIDRSTNKSLAHSLVTTCHFYLLKGFPSLLIPNKSLVYVLAPTFSIFEDWVTGPARGFLRAHAYWRAWTLNWNCLITCLSLLHCTYRECVLSRVLPDAWNKDS